MCAFSIAIIFGGRVYRTREYIFDSFAQGDEKI